MAKAKKSPAKTSPKTKTAAKKVTNPLDAPRIKLPEDDLPPPQTPTIGGLVRQKITSFWAIVVRNKGKVVITILVLAVGGWAISNYMNTRNQLDQLANPKTSTQTEITIITDQVKGTIELPTGETPTIATVSDVDKLKSQNFFRNAENGDKVLIYSKAGKALLYRYTTKKVIEFSNVSLGGDQQTSGGNTQVQQNPTNQQSQNNTQNQQQTQQNSQSQGTQLQTQTPQAPQQ